MTVLRPVVLSGGSGTRLWPLSTRDRPKQFVPLIGESSLFEATLERVSHLPDVARPWVVTGSRHVNLVAEASSTVGVPVKTIVEPLGRNTAPAAVAAALAVDPEDVLVILPADHVIADEEAFRSGIVACAELAEQGLIVALGVVPTRAETGYGYIETGDPLGPGFAVSAFVEKPPKARAEEMVADGRYLWNAGMFIVRASKLLEEAERHVPNVVADTKEALAPEVDGRITLRESFEEVESISFDYAVMERTGDAAVVRLDAGWSDVGSYASLLEVLETDEAGNSLVGQVRSKDVTNTFVRTSSREVVVAGVEGLAVVETPDTVLIVGLDASQSVKDLADPH